MSLLISGLTIEGAEKNLQHLIRKFIVTTQTLGQLSSKTIYSYFCVKHITHIAVSRYLNIRLTYTKDCPASYQPPYFQDCTGRELEKSLMRSFKVNSKVLTPGSANLGFYGYVSCPSELSMISFTMLTFFPRVSLKVISKSTNQGRRIISTEVPEKFESAVSKSATSALISSNVVPSVPSENNTETVPLPKPVDLKTIHESLQAQRNITTTGNKGLEHDLREMVSYSTWMKHLY